MLINSDYFEHLPNQFRKSYTSNTKSDHSEHIYLYTYNMYGHFEHKLNIPTYFILLMIKNKTFYICAIQKSDHFEHLF